MTRACLSLALLSVVFAACAPETEGPSDAGNSHDATAVPPTGFPGFCTRERETLEDGSRAKWTNEWDVERALLLREEADRNADGFADDTRRIAYNALGLMSDEWFERVVSGGIAVGHNGYVYDGERLARLTRDVSDPPIVHSYIDFRYDDDGLLIERETTVVEPKNGLDNRPLLVSVTNDDEGRWVRAEYDYDLDESLDRIETREYPGDDIISKEDAEADGVFDLAQRWYATEDGLVGRYTWDADDDGVIEYQETLSYDEHRRRVETVVESTLEGYPSYVITTEWSEDGYSAVTTYRDDGVEKIRETYDYGCFRDVADGG